ncbi:histone deacetylase [Coemansia sp. RSA 1836]|nr:histone deacetylase [Coemansia sp. RSA 1836]
MNDYMDYYAPEYTLNVPAYNVENSNSPEYLERIRNQVLQNLERTRFAPSVQMQDTPRDVDRDTVDEDALDPDERMPETTRDQHVVPDTEMYEADSMGMPDFSRDNTKVVNEETNDLPVITADAVEVTANDDVEMTDADADADTHKNKGAEDLDERKPPTESVQQASNMEVDAADTKQEVDAASAELIQELAPVAADDSGTDSPDKLASAEPVLESSAIPDPTAATLEANKDLEAGAKAAIAEEEGTEPQVKSGANSELRHVSASTIVADVQAEQKAATDTTTTPVSDTGETVQIATADVKAETESASNTGAQASVSASPIADSISEGIASLAVEATATASHAEQAPPIDLAAEPSSEAAKDPVGSDIGPSTEDRSVTQVSQNAKSPVRALAPAHKAIQAMKIGDREDGEATEDDYDDEDGEIRDS